jgi:hypothetical protein
MSSLKRHGEFIDDTSGGSLLIGCGWLLDCFSPREIHVLALSMFLWMNNYIGIFDKCWLEVFALVIYVLNG